MNVRRILLLAILLTTAGCVTGYTLVQPGLNSAQDMQITADYGWNMAPVMMTPGARKGTQTWTQDGLLLDRLVLVPAVGDGETLLIDRSGTGALPVFRKDMLPNEIEELAESTLVKYFGEGQATVSTSNLRPQMFGDRRGLMFDLSAQLSDAPDYKGTIGAFIADDKLYSIWFIAADPHYHDKHNRRAEAIIRSASLLTNP